MALKKARYSLLSVYYWVACIFRSKWTTCTVSTAPLDRIYMISNSSVLFRDGLGLKFLELHIDIDLVLGNCELVSQLPTFAYPIYQIALLYYEFFYIKKLVVSQLFLYNIFKIKLIYSRRSFVKCPIKHI